MDEPKAHVVIVGAGIVGVSTAIWAMRDGFSVTLVDRSRPGDGTSYGNAGLLASSALVPVTVPGLLAKTPRMAFDPGSPLFINWAYIPRLLPWLWQYLRHANAHDTKARAEALLPLIGDSLSDHQTMAAGTGAEHWIVPCDYVMGYPSGAAIKADHLSWEIRKQAGFECRTLEGAELRQYDPALGSSIACGVVMPGHGRIGDPGRYVKDLARHAERQGARFLQAEVEGVLQTNGHVTGVRANGQVIACDRVALTAGVWSGALAKDLGLRVPLAPESGFHLELTEPSVTLRSPVMVAEGKFVMTPMEGRLRLAGMVGYVGLNGRMPDAPFRLFEKHVRRALPDLRWRDTRRWMGHRPAITDSRPLIGAVPAVKGAFVGFGHDHVGLTAGPRTGRLLAQLMSGAKPNIDLTPFAPDRFG
ncbi:MAG: FAD-dependent oxidoreductase [Pseudomonadota bacterium]